MDIKSPSEYKTQINKYLEMVKISFSFEGTPKKCEQVLMKKLNEIYSLFHLTKDEKYKETFRNGWKKYNKIINKKLTSNKLLKLEQIEQDSTTLHPEEMETELLMWRNSIIFD